MVRFAIAVLFLCAASLPALPAQKDKPGAPAKLTPIQLALYNTLKAHIRAEVKRNFGFYPLEDKEYNESWMTKLEDIDVRKPRRVFEDEYIVRAAFRELPMDALARTEGQEAPGEPPDAADLESFKVDFTLLRSKKGGWKIKDKALYSIGETKLFRYTDQHERVRLEREYNTSAFSFDGPGRVPPTETDEVGENGAREDGDGSGGDALLPNDPRPDGVDPGDPQDLQDHEAETDSSGQPSEEGESDDPFASGPDEDGGGRKGGGQRSAEPCPDCDKEADGAAVF